MPRLPVERKLARDVAKALRGFDMIQHDDRILVAYGDCGTGGLLDQVLAEEGVERIEGLLAVMVDDCVAGDLEHP